MPKRLCARLPLDATEERQLRKLAGARHAPGDGIRRARMSALSGQGQRTTPSATTLGCQPQTVRERWARCNAEGLAGRGDRCGAGRTPRLTERERRVVSAWARRDPPGKRVRRGEGAVDPGRPDKEAPWSREALTAAVRARGVVLARRQGRRILQKEGGRGRRTPSWATREAPDVVPQGPGSARSTPPRPQTRRSWVPTRWAP